MVIRVVYDDKLGMQQPRLQYKQLEVGYEFPPTSYDLTPEAVARYLDAVEEQGSLYYQRHEADVLTGLVPPTALVAYSIAALSKYLLLPPGSIHVTQEIESLKPVSVGAKITCRATVSRRQDRGNLRLLTIDLGVFNQNEELVLSGKTGFIVSPEPDTGNKERKQ